MPLPAVKKKLSPHERQATGEIIAMVIGVAGLLSPLFHQIVHVDSGPGVKDLAKAMLQGDFALLKLSAQETPPDIPAIVFLCVGLIGLVSLSILRWRRAADLDRKALDEENLIGLRGALMVIHSLIIGAHPDLTGADGEVRLTVYTLIPSSDGGDPVFEQSMEYVGSSERGKAGRTFQADAGVIGWCRDESKPVIADRRASLEQDDEYVREIVETWKFTLEQAQKMRKDRMSFGAFPIFSGSMNSLASVLYLDSSHAFAFDPMESTLVDAAAGLAEYIRARYPNG